MFVSLSTASRFNCLWASGLIHAPTKTFPSRDVFDTFADSLGAAWTGSSGFLRVFVIASPNALLLISVLPSVETLCCQHVYLEAKQPGYRPTCKAAGLHALPSRPARSP